MSYKRYEIWLADLSPRFGTESGKTRPVLIVQSDLLNQVHPSTIICPITSTVKQGVSILRVNLRKGQGGLNRESAIMIDQVRSIDNKRFIKKLGDLPDSLRNSIAENLRIVLEL
jgi:mRNA interferase MazF